MAGSGYDIKFEGDLQACCSYKRQYYKYTLLSQANQQLEETYY
jgi:hypothetical protein